MIANEKKGVKTLGQGEKGGKKAENPDQPS